MKTTCQSISFIFPHSKPRLDSARIGLKRGNNVLGSTERHSFGSNKPPKRAFDGLRLGLQSRGQL